MPLTPAPHYLTISGNVTSAGAGYGLISTGTLTLNVGNNYAAIQSGNTISFVGYAGLFGVSDQGNTLGTTGMRDLNMYVAAYGEYSISIDQVTSDGSYSVTLMKAGSGNANMYPAIPEHMVYTTGLYSGSSNGANSTTLSGWCFPLNINQHLAVNNIRIPVSISINSSSSNVSQSFRAGFSFGLYTLNGASLSLYSSWSNTMTFSQASAANSTNMSIGFSMGWDGTSSNITTQGGGNIANVLNTFTGAKVLPLKWTANTEVIPPNLYWGVFAFSYLTSASNLGTVQSIGLVQKTYVSSATSGVWQEIFKATGNVTAAWPLMGLVSLAVTSNQLLPNSIGTANISSTAATNALATVNQSVWVQMISLSQ